jgi:hypothetical protein
MDGTSGGFHRYEALDTLLFAMKSRAPAASFALAIGILLTGTGLGLRAAPAAPGEQAVAAQVEQRAAVSAVTTDTSAQTPTGASTQTAVGGSAAAPAPAVAPEPLPIPKEAPAAAGFEQMKHVWQSLNNCGPAAVVMALSTLGVDESQEVARLALRGTDVRRGMGPQGVGPWVKQNFDLRSIWRNNGTNDLLKRLVANGFAPMVTQWMQDPSISRVSHWRTIRGYDDARGVFYVNDSMLGNGVALSYDWFARNWQSFAYRYMVIYRPEEEPMLKAILGRDWSEMYVRQAMYERTKAEALAWNTNFAWLAHGEAAYAYGMFEDAVAAFERGFSMGSPTGVFGLRNSYPQALRALNRRTDADQVAQQLNAISPVPSTAAGAPDPMAMMLMLRRTLPADALPLE